MSSKELVDLSLSPNLRTALQALRRRLMTEFDINRLVLFGSFAWGQPDEESDVDLLIVLNDKVNLETEDSISRVVLDINLQV